MHQRRHGCWTPTPARVPRLNGSLPVPGDTVHRLAGQRQTTRPVSGVRASPDYSQGRTVCQSVLRSSTSWGWVSCWLGRSDACPATPRTVPSWARRPSLPGPVQEFSRRRRRVLSHALPLRGGQCVARESTPPSPLRPHAESYPVPTITAGYQYPRYHPPSARRLRVSCESRSAPTPSLPDPDT
jgi:hypothetical protein